MKHKWWIYVITICCIFDFGNVGFAENELPEMAAQLYDLSVKKATELCITVSTEEFRERYMDNIDSSLQALIMDIDPPLSPDYMLVLSTPSTLDLEAVLNEYSIPAAMGATFCFDAIYDANSVYSDRSFAEWADRTSLYDVCGTMEDAPEAIYTVLVFSEDTPQIVTAFFRLNDASYITKTAFVYNKEIEPENIYAAFPIIASNLWGNLDSNTFDLRK